MMMTTIRFSNRIRSANGARSESDNPVWRLITSVILFAFIKRGDAAKTDQHQFAVSGFGDTAVDLVTRSRHRFEAGSVIAAGENCAGRSCEHYCAIGLSHAAQQGPLVVGDDSRPGVAIVRG